MADSPSSDEESSPSRGLDAAEQYEVTRRAVEDARWNVIGSMVYALFLVFVALIGAQFIFAGSVLARVGEPAALVAPAFGVVLVAGALFELARTFDVLPFR